MSYWRIHMRCYDCERQQLIVVSDQYAANADDHACRCPFCGGQRTAAKVQHIKIEAIIQR